MERRSGVVLSLTEPPPSAEEKDALCAEMRLSLVFCTFQIPADLGGMLPEHPADIRQPKMWTKGDCSALDTARQIRIETGLA